MGNIVKTAKCRFCGQMTQIEADEELTAAQAEEQATMTCNCTDAVEYQKEKQRKEKAMQNVAALFGEAAAPDKRCGEDNALPHSSGQESYQQAKKSYTASFCLCQ